LGLPDLDRLTMDALVGRRGEKWSTFPKDVLPAWVAEMAFPVADPIHRVLTSMVAQHDVGYPRDALDEGVPAVFAERMRQQFSWNVDPDRVELLTDVVQGMYLAVETLTSPGSGLVIQTPIYPPFLEAATDNGREIVENRLLHQARGYAIDFEALEKSIGPRTEMLLFCNPHNPSGRVFTPEELARLAEICLRHDLVVLSDEIHADLVYEGRQHIPLASIGEEIAARTITITSATKAFNIPGLRLAVAHFGSRDLQEKFGRIPSHARGGIGLLGIHATMAAWRDGQPWLEHVRSYLEARRDQLGALLAERVPEVVFRAPEATYLAWVDCRNLELAIDPARFFLERGKVAFSPGPNFGDGYPSYLRINFATSATLLEEAVDRMAAALGR
jgi:cystathionine beta-lyase